MLQRQHEEEDHQHENKEEAPSPIQRERHQHQHEEESINMNVKLSRRAPSWSWGGGYEPEDVEGSIRRCGKGVYMYVGGAASGQGEHPSYQSAGGVPGGAARRPRIGRVPGVRRRHRRAYPHTATGRHDARNGRMLTHIMPCNTPLRHARLNHAIRPCQASYETFNHVCCLASTWLQVC